MAAVNPYLEKVLEAERRAATELGAARDARLEKIRSAADAAEAEVQAFKASEEDAFRRDADERYGSNTAAEQELDEMSKQDIALVKRDYKEHRDRVVGYLTKSTLVVDLSLMDVQKRYLRDAARGRTTGYV